MKTSLWLGGALAVALCLPSIASAQWSDDFDSYTAGGLVPQGGWNYWDFDPAFQALVSTQVARSAPHALEIQITSDVTQSFGPFSSGVHTLTAYNYIPTGAAGVQYLILLNQYTPGGGPRSWSLQMQFQMDTGLVIDADAIGGATALIVRDTWVEVKVVIDLDVDTQTVSYNGTEMFTKTWSGGSPVPLSDPGTVTFGTLDLFSDGGDSIWWDDLTLNPPTLAVEEKTWGALKSIYGE